VHELGHPRPMPRRAFGQVLIRWEHQELQASTSAEEHHNDACTALSTYTVEPVLSPEHGDVLGIGLEQFAT